MGKKGSHMLKPLNYQRLAGGVECPVGKPRETEVLRSEGTAGMNEAELNEGGFVVQSNEWLLDIL